MFVKNILPLCLTAKNILLLYKVILLWEPSMGTSHRLPKPVSRKQLTGDWKSKLTQSTWLRPNHGRAIETIAKESNSTTHNNLQ
jgi:hypothetical protein